ncbi:uncharacterized protein LOC115571075 [Sparus aurata]|uniref:uncharacterized protein LOC115571075 n=1 Tax=Sparus aurata TaxID=8175 RepID=UPI0011C0E55A|nr:uncharacterized protein LOC115571075 [Sparus aurata]
MAVSDRDGELLRSTIRTQSTGSNTGVSSYPEQRDDPEPDIQPESNQGTPGPGYGLPPQADIETRIQQLNSRLFLLQHVRQMSKDTNGGTIAEMTSEDSDKLCELEAVLRELEELRLKKELKKQSHGHCHRQGAVRHTFSKTETPHGGICVLPHHQPSQEDTALQQTGPVHETGAVGPLPVDSLAQAAAVTRCPSCQEVVLTETRSTVGEAMWLLCCLFSMMGGFAGCCLIPFFMDHLRDVHHQCPNCQVHIHTFQPL